MDNRNLITVTFCKQVSASNSRCDRKTERWISYINTSVRRLACLEHQRNKSNLSLVQFGCLKYRLTGTSPRLAPILCILKAAEASRSPLELHLVGVEDGADNNQNNHP